MPIHLISLVIFLFLATNNSLVFSAESKDFIYPKDKPSVFKKSILKTKNIKKDILPSTKPVIQKKLTEIKAAQILKADEKQKTINIKNQTFLIPKKKTKKLQNYN